MTDDDQYAMGFAEGETQRGYDKQKGLLRQMPPLGLVRTMRSVGFWDGYTPRSIAWAFGTKPMVFESICE
jgi:hypothetical protein